MVYYAQTAVELSSPDQNYQKTNTMYKPEVIMSKWLINWVIALNGHPAPLAYVYITVIS